MNDKPLTYVVLLPLAGNEGAYHESATSTTPEGAAEVVRILLAHPAPHVTHIRIEIRRML
jgi:hypothetical protein